VLVLQDPDGHRIELVVGQEKTDPLPAPDVPSWNEAGGALRRSTPRRSYHGPSHVLRLGHIVFATRDFRRASDRYETRFGLLRSEEVRDEGGETIGAFYRFDLGDEPADHHALFVFHRPSAPGFLHAAFEVMDLDDLMAGHEHLSGAGAQPYWGVGRHKLGSQVFDYWLDPWGRQLEHWTDGDRLTVDVPTQIVTLDELRAVQWGMRAPLAPRTP
jgi:catechol 2,3-dioxygenase-like lactoylglutathione lyase family enzyme